MKTISAGQGPRETALMSGCKVGSRGRAEECKISDEVIGATGTRHIPQETGDNAAPFRHTNKLISERDRYRAQRGM